MDLAYEKTKASISYNQVDRGRTVISVSALIDYGTLCQESKEENSERHVE